MKTVLFYVSGHGYGHATRAAAVISALRRHRPNIRVIVRTAAPRMLFGDEVDYRPMSVDATVVETADALSVDAQATADAAAQFFAAADTVVERELRFIASSGVQLIAGDIPPIAGEIARRSGLPSVAIGNFTWDWILAGVAPRSLLERIRDGYRGYTEALRLPLSHAEGWEVFRRVTDVPLLTPRSDRPREQIRTELGITGVAVLAAGRGRLPQAVLDRVRSENPEIHLLTVNSHPVFSDLVRAADVVVSKIGYSTAAECIAEQTRLLFPPRTGFREEDVLAREVPAFVPALPIGRGAWERGEWKQPLEELLAMPRPENTVATNGDDVCAGVLSQYL